MTEDEENNSYDLIKIDDIIKLSDSAIQQFVDHSGLVAVQFGDEAEARKVG